MSLPPSGPAGPRRGHSPQARGFCWVMLAFFLFSVCDMITKQVSTGYHPAQVAWARQAGLFVGTVALLSMGGWSVLRSRRPGLQFLRGATAVVSTVSFAAALRYLPLADATAVTFVAPLLITALAAVLLKERVSPMRWAAVGVGLAGTLIMLRPGAGVAHPAMLLVLLCAATYALRHILSRILTGTDPLRTTIAWSSLVTTLSLSAALSLVGTIPDSLHDVLMFLGIAVTAACAELALIRGFALAQAATLAPAQYTLMVWSVLWGVLIFDQFPDFWTLGGAAIIIASGAYSVWQEARER
ncbi:EamA family transporter [Paracoccus sp. YIM 132242]|uniref:EamA family transporter n=1 Tax=Paracoccus lichenicola TaxID=2665644 RepID=A0A6L6HUK3_9RHOB|nr:DMT family transporter [Paracoccus lichenicola]MTE01725.1 EamA family transporter [Paracoccus lichenicola]